MKLRKIIIAGIFLTLGLLIPKPQAIVETVNAEHKIKTCPMSYYSFIINARSEHTRHEYFKDFFKTNFCQVSDIILLNDQLEGIRDEFRSAAFECKDVSSYEKEYIRVLLEVYFVRHVQEFSSGTLEEHEIEALEEEKQGILDDLQVKMNELFVIEEAQVTETQLDEYFESWGSKYDDKIINYAACDEGPWAEVGETWNDFLETINKLDVEVEKKQRDGKFFQLKKGEGDIDTKDWTKVKNSMKSFFNKFKKQEEDEVERPLTVDEATFRGGSLSEAFDILEDTNLIFEIESNSAERMAEYQLRYGEGGARTTTDLQLLIKGINDTVEDTNTTDFPNIITNVRKVIDKQCS